MDRGQIVGGVLGLVTLLAAFLLPFSSIAEGNGGSVDSLLYIFKLFVTTLGNIEAVPGLTQLTQLAFVYMAAFILVGLSGVIGSFPRWGGIVGILGMAAVTVAPFAIFTTYTFNLSTYGAGFWLIWATSVAMLAADFWSSRERSKTKPAEVASSPAAPTAPMPAAS